MEKIIMIVEKSKDFFDAYSDNCDGIYAAGDSIEAFKADAMEAFSLIKNKALIPTAMSRITFKREFDIIDDKVCNAIIGMNVQIKITCKTRGNIHFNGKIFSRFHRNADRQNRSRFAPLPMQDNVFYFWAKRKRKDDKKRHP